MEQHALHAVCWTDVRDGWTQWLLSRLAQNTLTCFIWYHRFHSYIQHSLISGMTNPMCFVKWKKRWKKFWIKCFVCPFGPKVISSRKSVMRVVEIWQNDKTINIYSQNKLKCDGGFQWFICWYHTCHEKEGLDMTEAFKNNHGVWILKSNYYLLN